ncbi:unnamed protein product, partial [Leptidea sinapis]
MNALIKWTGIVKLWEILNQSAGRIKKSLDSVIKNTFGKQNIEKVDLANNFAKHFTNKERLVIPKCSNALLNRSTYTNSANVTMRFRRATSSDIEKIIKSINVKKSPGIDGIRPLDKKNICTKISKVIANLINKA